MSDSSLALKEVELLYYVIAYVIAHDSLAFVRQDEIEAIAQDRRADRESRAVSQASKK